VPVQATGISIFFSWGRSYEITEKNYENGMRLSMGVEGII
jgi:hypothetical protein